mgnify:CR=1 FL=1
MVYDYNITNGTLGSSPVFDFASTPGAAGAISGGAFVGTYNGKTCFFGNVQGDPNVVGIYELADGAPVPPTPIAGILGAMVFVDGELITAEPNNNSSISISNIKLGAGYYRHLRAHETRHDLVCRLLHEYITKM